MLLRKDDPWPQELPIPDIRNWRVLDQNDNEIGFVETLVVNRPDGNFEALLVGANDRFAADDVEVEDGVVRIKHPLHRATPRSDESNGPPPEFEDSFRRHFERTFDDDRLSFEEVLPAYRFGREAASDADFAGRSFDSAREDLMARYRSENRSPPFEIAREAIAWALDLVHRNRPFETAGMSREELQILDRSAHANDRGQTAGGAMSTTTPSDK